MQAMRYLCRLQLPRWSMLVAPLFYLVFVLFILNLTFPLSSLGRRQAPADARNGAGGIENSSAATGNRVNEVAYRVEPKPPSSEDLQTLKESFYQ